MPTVLVLKKNLKKPQIFKVSQKETILNSLEEQGEHIPHGCRSGACGSCKIIIHEGEKNLQPPSEIEKDTIESIRKEIPLKIKKTIRLACRAKIINSEAVAISILES